MNSGHLIETLRAQFLHRSIAIPKILTDCCCGADAVEYEAARQIFNRKFEFRPKAIFMVENTEQVALIVGFVSQHPGEILLRARSGGHDHEGECTGTDTWQINFRLMNKVTLDEVKSKQQNRHVVRIEPGTQFQKVKREMDKMGKNGLSIAHGTCETVCVAGYTMGGGWGPWTRRFGMGCERLIGATIVLGNGERLDISDAAAPGSKEACLLWALRGGGGFSYGIVTELVYDAFEIPKDLFSFQVYFVGEDKQADQPAIDILEKWEKTIAGNSNDELIGTNLMITAQHLAEGEAPDPDAKLSCMFNGFYNGTEAQLKRFIESNFGKQYLPSLSFSRYVRPNKSGLYQTSANGPARKQQWHFGSWDRLGSGSDSDANNISPGIQLETEGPAPHKITSRLANEGWNRASRVALICALQSPLVQPQPNGGTKKQYDVRQYITIGAITGPFYSQRKPAPNEIGSAFPYPDRLFTLQFQSWWDQYRKPDGGLLDGVTEQQARQISVDNRLWANHAENWIEACRNADIPHSGNAFISFKDDAVRTDMYFDQSYQPLIKVKTEHSEDPHLLFQTRKTIL
jgi:FAD binding domain